MAYKYAKGKVYRGDIYDEDDTQRDTYIDFGGGVSGKGNYIGLVASGSAVLVVTGSSVGIGTASPTHEFEVHPNEDITAIIGCAFVGHSFNTDAATFGHRDLQGSRYAIYQNSAGRTILNTGASQAMYFRINESNKAILDSSGQFGIGTTSAQSLLHVSSSGDEALLSVDGATNGNVLFVTGSGRVGIGTDSPSEALSVIGDISGSGDLLLGGKIGLGDKQDSTPSAMLHISSSYTQTNPLVQIEAGDDGEDGAQLLIKGNMRPNTQATSTLIELNSNLDSRARGIHLTCDDGNEEWFSGVPYPGGRYQIGFDGTSGLPWRLNSSSFDILESGDVGIGTAGNPSAKFHVIDTGEIMRLGYDTSNYTSFTVGSDGTLTVTTNQAAADLKLQPANILELGTAATDAVYIGRTDTTSDTIIYGGTSGAEVMRIDGSADSVGIGTATPNSTFQVSGSQAGNYTQADGNITFNETHYIVDYTGNGNATFTLPDVSGITGRVYHVLCHQKSEEEVNLTVTGSGGPFQGPNLEGDQDSIRIDGNTPQSITVVSTGGNWFVLNDNRSQEHG